jgi:hypothetical protein
LADKQSQKYKGEAGRFFIIVVRPYDIVIIEIVECNLNLRFKNSNFKYFLDRYCRQTPQLSKLQQKKIHETNDNGGRAALCFLE